ncbi:hydrolase [Planctomycetota bacterium]
MLKPESTVLIIVDVQGKLAQLMHEKESLFENVQKIIKGVQVLEIPILWAEQNPKGLGPTIPEVADLLTDIESISKVEFSCCRNTDFMQALKEAGRNQVLIAGIETHVCIYQTVMDLISSKYEVEVVADAVSSRTLENKELALQKMRGRGVGLTCVEMALFELLGSAQGDTFKQILNIVK